MLRKLLIGAAAALTLSGCSAPEEQVAVVAESAPLPTPIKSQRDVDPEAYESNVASAIAEIPESIKGDFKILFVCEARKNSLRQHPKPIDADYIRTLTAYLKAHPAAGQNCTL